MKFIETTFIEIESNVFRENNLRSLSGTGKLFVRRANKIDIFICPNVSRLSPRRSIFSPRGRKQLYNGDGEEIKRAKD